MIWVQPVFVEIEALEEKKKGKTLVFSLFVLTIEVNIYDFIWSYVVYCT